MSIRIESKTRRFSEEITVDLFAGGGGASEGIRMATGRDPDIAINHDAIAIAMHRANHPLTQYFIEDVWKVRPLEATQGRPVGLLWASPDCKHFSIAKGAKLVRSKEIRASVGGRKMGKSSSPSNYYPGKCIRI